MNNRPLHAVLLSGPTDAKRLVDPLAKALDGTGPAILPLDAGLPPARLRQHIDVFKPDAVVDAGRSHRYPFRNRQDSTGHGGDHRDLRIHRGAEGG